LIEFDLAAAHRVTAVEVDVGERTATIPPTPALGWLDVVTADGVDWSDIVPGMLADPGPVDDDLIEGRLSREELTAAAQDAITAAAGVRWSVALALAFLANRADLGGQLVLHRVNPAEVSLGAYVVACYTVAITNMDQDKRNEFDSILNSPPPGVDMEEWWDEDEAAAGFLAAMNASGGSDG
jgi:hypothetical protein